MHVLQLNVQWKFPSIGVADHQLKPTMIGKLFFCLFFHMESRIFIMVQSFPFRQNICPCCGLIWGSNWRSKAHARHPSCKQFATKAVLKIKNQISTLTNSPPYACFSVGLNPAFKIHSHSVWLRQTLQCLTALHSDPNRITARRLWGERLAATNEKI